MFQSTHPGWGATYFNSQVSDDVKVSIHAPRVGCDSVWSVAPCVYSSFNPRTPGGVRLNLTMIPFFIECFNPRTPGGVRRDALWTAFCSQCVSIHAPRVGCDTAALLVGNLGIQFQSTHPGWGATYEHLLIGNVEMFQSTHPGWGATV